MPQKVLKVFMILLVLLPVVLFFALGGYQRVGLERLQDDLVLLLEYKELHPTATLVIFGLGDFAVSALSLPIALLFTLSSGALFDFWTALLLVSLASNLGAIVPFLIARYVARDTVAEKFAGKLAIIQQGIEREGAWYLFAIRLTPLFPFWLVNLLTGLTPMRTMTYLLVTVLGTLPGRILYIIAGKELAELEFISDIASPRLLLALTLLGVLPLVARKILQRLHRKAS